VLILALDTSSPSGSLAVLRDDNVVGTVSTWAQELHSARTFLHVESLLRELSLGLDAFDLFAVAAGPGSFTGLRVGLAAVKGWAEVYQKPIAAVSALEAIAMQSSRARSSAAALVPVLDARRGQIYFGFYRSVNAGAQNRLALEGEECVAMPEEFVQALQARRSQSDFAIVTPVPELVRAALSRLETADIGAGTIHVDEVSPILAPHIGRLGYLLAQRGELANALTLDANYIRRSDAEVHRKEPPGS
jgi:tRNA threonylcarbamoyladenosine biosynthesis protein TsaB